MICDASPRLQGPPAVERGHGARQRGLRARGESAADGSSRVAPPAPRGGRRSLLDRRNPDGRTGGRAVGQPLAGPRSAGGDRAPDGNAARRALRAGRRARGTREKALLEDGERKETSPSAPLSSWRGGKRELVMNSGKLLVAGVVVLVGVGIALFTARRTPQAALSSNPDVNRNTAHTLPGRTSEQRAKIDPGLMQSQVASMLA